MDGIQALFEYAETQQKLIRRERERLTTLKSELASMLAYETCGDDPALLEFRKKAALQYREELRKQIEDKRKREEELRKQEVIEDALLSRSLFAQYEPSRPKNTLLRFDDHHKTISPTCFKNLNFSDESEVIELPKEPAKPIAQNKKKNMSSRVDHPVNFAFEETDEAELHEIRRLAALRYRDELRNQIEEKRKREEEQRQLDEVERKQWERKVEDQRRRMHFEYLNEEERLKKKADDLLKRQELANAVRPESPIRKKHALPVINSGNINISPRSPSYLHLKLAKAPPLHRHTSSIKTLEDRLRQSTASAADNERILPTDTSPVASGRVTLPDIARPMNPTPPYSQESANDINNQIENSDRTLARLIEMRKRMEENHLKMLKQLKIDDGDDDEDMV